MVSRILAFKRWQDSHACLFGKLLLSEGLDRFGYPNGLYDVRYRESHKPFVNHELKFNISHSAQYVVCAFSTLGEIGVDIEKIEPLEIQNLKPSFTRTELDVIESAADPYTKLFEFWTIKEAVIKAEGRGLQIPLNSFDVLHNPVKFDGCNWLIERIHLVDLYQCHVALKSDRDPIGNISVECHNFYDA